MMPVWNILVIFGNVMIFLTLLIGLWVVWDGIRESIRKRKVESERKKLNHRQLLKEIECEDMFEGDLDRQPTKWYVSNGDFKWVGLATTAGEAVCMSLVSWDNQNFGLYFRVNKSGHSPKSDDTLFETQLALDVSGFHCMSDEYEDDDEGEEWKKLV